VVVYDLAKKIRVVPEDIFRLVDEKCSQTIGKRTSGPEFAFLIQLVDVSTMSRPERRDLVEVGGVVA
jgi:hypothetical protein